VVPASIEGQVKITEPMQPSIAIRQADASHLEVAWGIVERCRAALREAGIPQWDDVYPTRDTVAEDIAQGSLFILATSAVPHAIVALNSHQDDQYRAVSWVTAEPALVVHRLCVDPHAQGRGLARLLMTFAETFAAEHGFASVRLDAYSGNPAAVALYRHCGYREAGRVRFARRALPFYCFERAITSASRPTT
jgi:ribosomal protein S18 acetylase RimI-like enzyme